MRLAVASQMSIEHSLYLSKIAVSLQQESLLPLTEQSLKLVNGIIAFVLALVTPAGVVILISIVQALLFASVRT